MQPYVPTKQWKDGFGAGETRIMAADLTRMEAGISAATQGVTNVESRVGTLDTSVTTRLQTMQNAIMEAARALIPIGTITMYAGGSAPQGWVTCNGQLLDRTTYSKLFTVIGTSYGSTTGSNFRVPDIRDRFPVGAGSSYPTGSTGGAAEVKLLRSQMPAHTHGIGGLGGTALQNGVGMYASNVGGGQGWQVLSTTEQGSLSGLIAKSEGGGEAHENRPPYMAFPFIIKAS
jgi:microcystin-dependent protein